MEATVGKVAYSIGAQLLMMAVLLIVVFAILYAASRGWKKGQESGYMVDGGDRANYGL
jgi:hypothetical protein